MRVSGAHATSRGVSAKPPYDNFMITCTYKMLADESGNHPVPETEEILLSILRTDKPLSIREIAEMVGKSVPSTRYHVNKLVDMGLAVPTASSTSRNRKYLRKQEASL